MNANLLRHSFSKASTNLKKSRNHIIRLKRLYSTDENIVYSRCPDVPIPKVSLYEYICDKIKQWPDKIALECMETGRKYTYNDLYIKSSSLGHFLKETIKLNDDDAVAVILPNVPEYPIALLGAMLANVKATTVNPNYTSDEISRQLENSESKVVITLCDYYTRVSKAIKDANIKIDSLILIDHYGKNEYPSGTINFKEICGLNQTIPFKSPLDDKTVLLPYSSGTTGLPKGVELTNKNMVANFCQTASNDININVEATESFRDTVPVFLPLYHIYSLSVILIHGLCMGSKLITVPKFSYENFMTTVTKYKPTVGHLVPPIVMMVNTNPNIKFEHMQSFRTIMSGAAPLGSSDIEKFKQKTNNQVNVLQGYGMTETAPMCLMQSLTLEKGIKEGGCGVLAPHTQAKIVPVISTTSMGVIPGQSGELFVKGPQVMKGYFKNEAATNDTMDDGWLRTGDIGHYDEDGQFYITDRLKELIKVKGFQVAPAELEEVMRNHPAVKEAAVIGIPHELHGEVPKAFVVIRPDCEFNTKDIQNFVSSKVATYKRLLGGIEQIEEIPKNPSGKILRRVLRTL